MSQEFDINETRLSGRITWLGNLAIYNPDPNKNPLKDIYYRPFQLISRRLNGKGDSQEFRINGVIWGLTQPQDEQLYVAGRYLFTGQLKRDYRGNLSLTIKADQLGSIQFLNPPQSHGIPITEIPDLMRQIGCPYPSTCDESFINLLKEGRKQMLTNPPVYSEELPPASLTTAV